MAHLYCTSLKRAPSARPTPRRINQGGQIWHAVISSARPPCLSVSICWYARTFPKLHRTFSGIALAGNTCFKLTGRGRANTAQQLHKGNKIEKSVLSPCQWGSLRGWRGRSLDVFFFFFCYLPEGEESSQGSCPPNAECERMSVAVFKRHLMRGSICSSRQWAERRVKSGEQQQ